MRAIGTKQLTRPQSQFNANLLIQIKMSQLSLRPGQTTINKIHIQDIEPAKNVEQCFGIG